MAPPQGTKRASPGADEGKPSLNVELSDENAKKLEGIQRQVAKIELFLERESQAKFYPVYEKRRPVVKAIPNFWPVALMNHDLVAFHAQHNADQVALGYLEDLWVTRDPQEHRCFTLEFHFKENQFFKNQVLKKEYKFIQPAANASDKADENGITDSMLDFEWHDHVKISSTKIEWKGDDKNLAKLYPREAGDEDDDLPAEAGSFFNFFEHDDDVFDLGPAIANEVFADSIDYFLGNVSQDLDIDSDDEEDDDDDDAEEIDLEKPLTKKRKV